MEAEKDLRKLLKTMAPKLNEGDFVFCPLTNLSQVDGVNFISLFKEAEGYTAILEKSLADRLGLRYSFVASWITLTVHSSLEAVGLTAAFSKALADEGISCNVIAAYYHDHIFVDKKDAKKSLEALKKLAH